MKAFALLFAATTLALTAAPEPALAKQKNGHCPPGLAKKNPPCVPPGQAKKRAKTNVDRDDYQVLHTGDRVTVDGQDYIIVRSGDRLVLKRDNQWYDLPGTRDDYVRVGDALIRVDRKTKAAIEIIRLADLILN